MSYNPNFGRSVALEKPKSKKTDSLPKPEPVLPRVSLEVVPDKFERSGAMGAVIAETAPKTGFVGGLKSLFRANTQPR